MIDRTTASAILRGFIGAIATIAAAVSVAAVEPTVILVSDTSSPLGDMARPVLRQPAHRLPDQSPDRSSHGISLIRTERGLTVLVESVAETGDPPLPDDNDFTRVDLAVQSTAVLGDGTEVRLVGVFDWNEPNAMASWAAADYAVIGPPGIADVRVYATELGDAVIEGPWELPDLNVYYEGFLHLFGGSYRGWTVENLVVRGFDWSIGMFFDAPGDFDDVTVRNNLVEVPEDIPGNHTIPSGEPFQNIGLHLAYGTNQTIEGNEIVIPGTAANTATEIASSVAMQSNTGDWFDYDGLVIANNDVRVLGAQASDPARIYGIWENAAAHASTITVSGNTFINENPGNDPALNFQRAFRVTSQSSATTTVSYTGNLAVGANIGIHWLGDGDTSSPPATTLPVVVEANTLLGNGTAVWVHTDDLAPGPGGEPTRMSQAFLRFNRMAGNLVGVRSDDAEVLAADNWWGCADGPGAGGCDPVVYTGTAGFLDPDPWLVLSLAIVPETIPVAGASLADADLHFNSDGLDTSAAGNIPDDTPVSFDATGGTVDPALVGAVLGQASSLYTAGMVPGEYEISATVDATAVATQITVTGEAALAMAMTPALQIRDDGETAELSITITNSGPDPVTTASVAVDFPAELGGIGWTCVGSGGGSCSNQGIGDIDDVADLPVGAGVTYTANGAVPSPFIGVLTVEGSVTPPDFITDSDPSDNTASAEIRAFRIFSDGFESGDTAAWSATVP